MSKLDKSWSNLNLEERYQVAVRELDRMKNDKWCQYDGELIEIFKQILVRVIHG